MKLKTIIAASALAATGVVGATTQSASACGVTLNVDNDKNYDVTVHWASSKVRAAPLGVPGTWSAMGSTDVTLDADSSGGGDDILKALNLTFSCGTARQYYVYWTASNGDSGYEYHNEVGSGGSWTTSTTPFIDIE